MFLPNHPVAAAVAEGLRRAGRGPGPAPPGRGTARASPHTLHGFRDAASLEVRRVTALSSAALGPADFAAAYATGQALTRADLAALSSET